MQHITNIVKTNSSHFLTLSAYENYHLGKYMYGFFGGIFFELIYWNELTKYKTSIATKA